MSESNTLSMNTLSNNTLPNVAMNTLSTNFKYSIESILSELEPLNFEQRKQLICNTFKHKIERDYFDSSEYCIIKSPKNNPKYTYSSFILDIVNNKVKSCHSKPTIGSIKDDFVQSYLNLPGIVDVKFINDGTTLTLYYLNDQWNIHSKNGFRLNNEILYDEFTYQRMVDDIFDFFKIKIDRFDTNYSYTFNFSHPELHIFQGKYRLFFICKTNLSTLEISTEHEYFKSMKRADISNPSKYLRKNAKNAYDNYFRRNDKPPLFGYMLSNPNSNFNLIIESSLLRTIGKALYQNGFNTHPLNIYLSGRECRRLFPQYNNYFQKYDIYFENAIDNILGENVNEMDSSLQKVIKVNSLDKIRSPGNITEKRGILRDLLVNRKYYELYLEQLNNVALETSIGDYIVNTSIDEDILIDVNQNE